MKFFKLLFVTLLFVPALAMAQNYQPPQSYYNSLPKNQQPTSTQTTQTPVEQPQPVETQITDPSTAQSSNETFVVAQNDQKDPLEDSNINFNPAFLRTRFGALEAEFEELKKAKFGNELAGYNGGFFIKSADDQFKIKFNGRFQVRYAYIAAEDFDDGHTFVLRRGFLSISGNAYGDKVNYFTLYANGELVAFDVSYAFNDWFSLHAVGGDSHAIIAEVADSSGKLSFLSKSLVGNRYDVGGSLGLYITGGNSKFGYDLKIFNGINSGFKTNANNELGYSGRVVYNVFGKMSSGQADLAYSEKPALSVGLGAVFGHYEDNTQARLFASGADIRFKYKGLSLYTAAVFRQTDLDRFTRAQDDYGVVGQASYFIIPKKLELAARASALFDDTTNAGVNINMFAGNITRLGGNLSGGDVGLDSDNEYEFSGALSYYAFGYNLKLQAQYSMIIDGILGPDDRTNHIGMVQAMVGF